MSIVFRAVGMAHFLEQFRSVPKWVRETADEVADDFVDLIHEGFDKGRSPTGRKWAPLVLRQGRPLLDNRVLRNSWQVTTRASRAAGEIRFIIESSDEVAAYHQRGTGIYGPKNRPIVPVNARSLYIPGYGHFASVRGSPPRPMVPENNLPVRWRRVYERAFERAFEEHFE